MPSYVLKLYENAGLASREVGSIVIEATDNDSAIEKAPRAQRPLIDGVALAVLMDASGTPIWVGSELTGFAF